MLFRIFPGNANLLIGSFLLVNAAMVKGEEPIRRLAFPGFAASGVGRRARIYN
jgi:hypothetical protein